MNRNLTLSNYNKRTCNHIYKVKALFTLSFFLLLFTTPGITQRPIAYYTFDNSATDNSGNNNNGIIHGSVAPVRDRFGAPCGALQFDGQTGFIEVPSSPSLELPSSAITITLWYKITASSQGTKWLTAVCKGNGSSELQNPQYRLQVQQSPGMASRICNNPDGSSTISLNTEFTKCDNNFSQHIFETEKWCFYALVFDGSRISAYMNDVKIFEQSYNGRLAVNSSPLHIGIDEPGVTEYFNGAMDDLRIYKDALSENEVLRLYNEKRPDMFDQDEFELATPQNIILHVPFNGCTAKAIFKDPVIKSSCNQVSLAQTAGPLSGTSLECGSYTVSYSASSTSGYTQSCSFKIYVDDNIPPTLKVPGDTILYIQKGEKGVHYNYKMPEASDNCQVSAITLRSGNNSGDLFLPGKNLVTYMAKDIHNNEASKSFMIEVREISAPKPVIDTHAIVRQHLPVVPPRVIDTAKVISPPAVDTTKHVDIIHEPDTTRPDTTVNTVITKKDSLFLKRDINKTITIEADSPVLQVRLYDNAIIDGDTVSLYLNTKMILENRLLGAKPIELDIAIDTTIDNELSMYAENLGTIPPNTALMVVMDGNKRYEVFLSSSLTSCGTIVVRKKKK